MRKLLIAAVALTLSACAGQVDLNTAGAAAAGAVVDQVVTVKPADVSNGTVLDEAIGLAWTKGYTAASRLGTSLARAGVIDKAGFKKADQIGYDATVALRQAYLAGNAASYAEAINRTQTAIASILALVSPLK